MTAPAHTTPPELLTNQQAADWLHLTPRWLVLARLRGNGPPFVKCGRLVRYRRSDLDRWIDEQTRTSTSASPHESASR